MLSKFLKQTGLASYLLIILSSFQYVQAAEDNLYDFLWLDPDKKVYVLQNKTYRKKGSLFIEASGIKTIGNPFIGSVGFGGKLGYYISEELGIDFFMNMYSASPSGNFDGVVSLNEGEPFVRYAKSIMGGTLLWTPFYGKVNTFNKIYYFDWGFGVGVGLLKTETNLSTAGTDNNTAKKFVSEDGYLGITYKTNFKFHINKSFHISIELQNFHYQAPGPGELDNVRNIRQEGDKKLNTHTDFLLGFGYKF